MTFASHYIEETIELNESDNQEADIIRARIAPAYTQLSISAVLVLVSWEQCHTMSCMCVIIVGKLPAIYGMGVHMDDREAEEVQDFHVTFAHTNSHHCGCVPV